MSVILMVFRMANLPINSIRKNNVGRVRNLYGKKIKKEIQKNSENKKMFLSGISICFRKETTFLSVETSIRYNDR